MFGRKDGKADDPDRKTPDPGPRTPDSLKTLLGRVRRIEIAAQRLVNESLSGRYHSVFKGRGMSFDEVRPYSAGDEVRLIDWNVSARTGDVFVKRFVEERELTVVIVADASASLDFGLSATEYHGPRGTDQAEDTKRELAAQIAAAIALSAQRNNDRVGLITFGPTVGTFIPPRKGRRHALRVIREVLAMEAGGTPTDLAGALAYLGRVQKRRAAVFIISDFLVPGFERELRVAARRHDVHALVVGDPHEADLARIPPGVLTVEDPETGAIERVWTGRAFLDRYRKAEEVRKAGLQQVFKRLRVPFTDFGTHQPYDRLLAGHFARLKGTAL